MNDLDSWEEEIREAFEAGMPWPEIVDRMIKDDRMRNELWFHALDLTIPGSAISAEQWLLSLKSYARKALLGFKLSKIQNFSNYLRRTLRNCKYDLWTDCSKGTRSEGTTINVPEGEAIGSEVECHRSDPALQAMRLRDLRNCISKQINQLFGPRVRGIMEARILHGEDLEDIASAMGVSESRVCQIYNKKLPLLKIYVRRQCLGESE